MPGTQAARAPALCSSPQPPPLQPLGAPGTQSAGAGACRHPGAGREVRVLPAPRAALPRCFLFFCQPEAACVSGCFQAAPRRRRCAGPPALAPAAGSWGTHGSSYALACRRASRELASGRAAIGAEDPCGLASCNLAFTRLWGCKGLN